MQYLVTFRGRVFSVHSSKRSAEDYVRNKKFENSRNHYEIVRDDKVKAFKV